MRRVETVYSCIPVLYSYTMQSKMHLFKQIITDLLCTGNTHAVRDHLFGE